MCICVLVCVCLCVRACVRACVCVFVYGEKEGMRVHVCTPVFVIIIWIQLLGIDSASGAQ